MTMTVFELGYSAAVPFLPPIYGEVRRELRRVAGAAARPRPLEILDVGGRKSHYTIGLPGVVTISELPRESATQTALNLGLTDDLAARTKARRSNVRAICYDDMTATRLPDASFDCVVAVEVLEHVEADDAFVRNVARVLRPGGTFVMTTPNGDAKPIPHNEDHKRHYRRDALAGLLRTAFVDVDVRYAIRGVRSRRLGLRSWSVRHPVRTLGTMAANVVGALQSTGRDVRDDMMGTHHLLAVARKGTV